MTKRILILFLCLFSLFCLSACYTDNDPWPVNGVPAIEPTTAATATAVPLTPELTPVMTPVPTAAPTPQPLETDMFGDIITPAPAPDIDSQPGLNG